VRIAIDIDSTLHDYWTLFEKLAVERYGVALPYAEQSEWGITALEEHQVAELVAETHSDANILAAEPYPFAPETIRGWHDQGHWIHITSHRSDRARGATGRWLERAQIPYDDLHCSFDKVTRCRELRVDILIDDSPVNLLRSKAHGINGATIIHPWNAELVRTDAIIGARDWRELAVRVAPVLSTHRRSLSRPAEARFRRT